MRTNIKTNLVGCSCKILSVSHHPVWGKQMEDKPDNREFRIVAVYLADGDEIPTALVGEIKLGSGYEQLVRVGVDTLCLSNQDLLFNLKK